MYLHSFLKIHNINLENYSIYKLEDKYFFVLRKNDMFLKNILPEYSLHIKDSKYLEDILLEYGKKIN